MNEEELQRRFERLDARISKLRKELKTSHWWDCLQALGPFAIAIVGAFFTWVQFSTSERNQTAQAMAQLQTNREQADTSLRAEMFKALVAQFFKGDVKPQEQIRLLALFENNFQEFFSAGPLFDLVTQSLSNAPAAEIEEINNLAKSMADRQELLFAGTNQAALVSLATNSPPIDVKAGDIHLRLQVTDIDTKKNRVRVTVNPQPSQSLQFSNITFHVSYFDMPITDNTKLPGGSDVPGGYHRFAITLKGIATNTLPATAQLKVIEIEHDYFTSVDRPSFDAFNRVSTEQVAKHSSKNLWIWGFLTVALLGPVGVLLVKWSFPIWKGVLSFVPFALTASKSRPPTN